LTPVYFFSEVHWSYTYLQELYSHSMIFQ